MFVRLVPVPSGTPSHSRKKDRLSYTHQEFAIDLTQVTATHGANSKVCFPTWLCSVPDQNIVLTTGSLQPELLHELEVELRDSEYLLMVAARRGQPEYSKAEQEAFDDLIHAFVNNARILVRNATPPDGPR